MSPRAAPMAMAVAALVAAALLACTADANIGINWGRQSAQRLLPSQVVDLMLQNGIKNVRIYSSENDILMAFQNSGINITINVQAIPKNMFEARRYVKWKYDVLKISEITSVILGGTLHALDVGPEYDGWWRGLNYMQEALYEFGMGEKTKVNFVHHSGLLTGNITKPSEAEFRPDIRDRMAEFVQYLRRVNAPFLVNFFPGRDLARCHLDQNFAFADNTSKLIIQDVNAAVYRNGFDWQYDCFVWALEKLNASDIRIVVAQVGWPTDGNNWANASNAERYFKYLLPMVSSNKGTPKRPGAPIDVFISSLADEHMMNSSKASLRHLGIYRSNGEPKYKIDLTGQGRDIYPSKVRGIMGMPERWCIFNGDSRDREKVWRQVQVACTIGDCTTMTDSGSCGKLGPDKNVSYAFNVYFQTFFQDEEACYFEGLGIITDQNPSTAECVFPVEVVKGEQVIQRVGAVMETTRRRIMRDNGVLLCVIYTMGLIVVLFLCLIYFDSRVHI